MKRISFLSLLIVLLLAGCSREAEPTQAATQTPEPPLGITYCDIDLSDMCLVGFGLDIDDRLLILFRADDHFFADIYIRADGPDGEMVFECQQSENFIENVYCLGETFPEGGLIKLNIFSKSNDKLIAVGVFNVQYGALPIRDVVFGAEATPTPSTGVSTPAASYPNPSYPNRSYPNPTSTPQP
ncbi:MAG: hypothetical protein WBL25_13975 [Anaerolineales bacterium]